jgi:hypothetical protein
LQDVRKPVTSPIHILQSIPANPFTWATQDSMIITTHLIQSILITKQILAYFNLSMT